MGDVIGPIIIGVLISALGIMNMKGNISSLHWYHRQRVSPDDVKPFGKRVGLSIFVLGNRQQTFLFVKLDCAFGES